MSQATDLEQYDLFLRSANLQKTFHPDALQELSDHSFLPVLANRQLCCNIALYI